MSKITFAVITRNEERRIEGCLSSAVWADEILVLDSHSVDRTVELCRRYTDKVFQHEFQSFPKQRNLALDLATGDWVLFVDADERVTPELAAEVQLAVWRAGSGSGAEESTDLDGEKQLVKPRTTGKADSSQTVGYWVPRKNFIWGKWIKHGGWYPDYQLRLLSKEKTRYDESREVHELVILQGRAGHLSNTFLHYNYETVGQFLRKQSFYCNFESRTLLESGIKAKPWSPGLQSFRAIKRRLWDLQGYRDGGHGLLLSVLLGYYEFVVYSKLLLMRDAEKG